jgi:hypothetical protein
MLVEIHNKMSERGRRGIEQSEDELTGNVFGSLRYLPFESGLKQVLLKARPEGDISEAIAANMPQGMQTELRATSHSVSQVASQVEASDLLRTIVGLRSEPDVLFWERLSLEKGMVEPDVILDFPCERTVVMIEVKYNSGLSGEKQLKREAEALAGEERFSHYENKVLLLLAKAGDAAFEALQESGFPRGVLLGSLCWQDVLEALMQRVAKSDVNDDCTRHEKTVLSDVCELLQKKGFGGFASFNLGKLQEDEDFGMPARITNAFADVAATYTNLRLLMKLLQKLAPAAGYTPMVPHGAICLSSKGGKTMGWDWLPWRFVMLYSVSDEDRIVASGAIGGIGAQGATCDFEKRALGDICNQFEDAGQLYVVELNPMAWLTEELEENNGVDEPLLFVCEYNYARRSTLDGEWSATRDIWYLDQPLHSDIMDWQDFQSVAVGFAKGGEPLRKYLGLLSIKCLRVPLLDVTIENASELVFGGFKRLRELDVS